MLYTQQKYMKKWITYFLIFAIAVSFFLYAAQMATYKKLPDWRQAVISYDSTQEIDLNKFIQKYASGEFQKITLSDGVKLQWDVFKSEQEAGTVMLLNQKIVHQKYDTFTTNKPIDTPLADLWITLTGAIPVAIVFTEKSILSTIFIDTLLPLLLLLVWIIVLFRFLWPKWGAGWFPFGWITAWKLRNKWDVKTTFKDVAGMDEAKEELKEIVDFLMYPAKYKKAGARVPKWVLLYWPPGSWKTLVARAVAGEAWVPFFSASWSEFMEMLVGMWAAKVRELFNKAKAASPSIIFIDEIDSIWKKRWQGYTGWHQEQEQTLNQILTEMDGFDKENNVIVIAATNRPETLDPALLRPWRFDRKVFVGRPTLEERKMILELHSQWKKLDPKADLDSLAKRTSWFVGADLENLMNEAALRVAKLNEEVISNDDLEAALEKVVMWPEKKIKTMKDKERKIITYHELGHAVTAFNLENADPVEKISIVSRWMALWVTWMMPQEDMYLYSKAKFLDELVTLLGGRAAEEIFFGKDQITTGASNDFEKVTKIATDMIMKYWMDEELGTLVYYNADSGEYTPFKPFSEQTAEIIDHKVKTMVAEAYARAIRILADNRDTIEKLAIILLDKEYLSKEEFEAIMKEPGKAEEIMKEIQEKEEKKRAERQKKQERSDKINEVERKKKEKMDKIMEKKWGKQNPRLEDMLDKFLPKKK